MPTNRNAARPWLTAYPPGVPTDIDVDRLGTLVDLFETSLSQFGDRPAVQCFGASLSYAAIGAAARDMAAWLAAQGLGKGDRVALMMPNVPAYPVAIIGVLLAGCTVVNINPLYTARELTAQLKDSGARVIVVLENFAGTVADSLAAVELDHVVVVGPGDCLGLRGRIIGLASRYIKKSVPAYSLPSGLEVGFEAMLRQGRTRPRATATVSPDDIAFLQYTGGTTGVAKAAMLTHRNIMANVTQSEAWFGLSRTGADRKVMVTALPLYHIFALTCCFFFFFKVGGSCLLITNPRDAAGFVKTLKANRFTHLSGVNTLFNLLLNQPGFDTIDFSSVEFTIAGGMAVQSPVANRWQAVTGHAIIEGYGLSETSPVVCVNPPGLPAWSGTIGYPLPSTDVAIRGLDGHDAPAGEPGELCVRGPQVMAGYWNRPDETARATTADGYFRTGDVAVMQANGQVRIVDRMKDMILVSGFNVYPNEVEEVLACHPGVLECAVVGASYEETGEMVVAHVVKKDEALTSDVLRTYARSQLTGYKVPRRIVFHDSLPKTNVGKVLRRALRDDADAA
ncbi:AMP-binding protein [uncultured Methylobacterium sp.]|uniref:AMP-binding protein n=1 Tax=uncultured Methylobacterium sp. TaxID=157278 RepID=UPI0035CC4FAC